MASRSLNRADLLITQQGLAKSRQQAQALIMAGVVCVGDHLVRKPSEEYAINTLFRLKEEASLKFVSRGGLKLEGALEFLGLDVHNFTALDIGMSTGGFTDCLLQRGACRVIGLDVGHNQLAWRLRTDSRVKFYEGINCRKIPAELISEKVDLVVVDVSFISLTYVLGEALPFLKEGGKVLALIKPQFEVGRDHVGRGGLVKDPLLHEQVREKILTYAQDLGLEDTTTFESVIKGTDGNKEFFLFGSLGSRRSPRGAGLHNFPL